MSKASLACRFVFGLALTSSGVAHSQAAAPADLVGRWRSPEFTDWSIHLGETDAKGIVIDTFATRTTILFQQDSTWFVYMTFRSRHNKHLRTTLGRHGGAWRRNGDTLWLAQDIDWLQTAVKYTPDGEAAFRDTLTTRPQPADTAWKAYRARIHDQQLSLGKFGAADTTAAAQPFVCPSSGAAKLYVPYDILVCPGIYDRRTASTP